MGNAAARIRANAEKLRTKPTGVEADPPTVAPRPAATPRQKNVRRTVDLSPAEHRGLDSWQRTAADRLGLARVTGQDVLCALVDQLINDDELGEQIINRIATRRG